MDFCTRFATMARVALLQLPKRRRVSHEAQVCYLVSPSWASTPVRMAGPPG